MTISNTFPGDSELVSAFPAQKRAEGATLLVDHTEAGLHNKVSLTDRDGSPPTGIPAGVLALWQDDGVLKARLGSGTPGPLSNFIELTSAILAQAPDLRPLRVLRGSGEARRIAFVNADGNTWGYLGMSAAGALVLEMNATVGGSPAASIDLQPSGVLNVYNGQLRVANNEVLHTGNFASIIPAAPTTAGAVGTYVFAARENPTDSIDFGQTVAGSSLRPVGMLSNEDAEGENTGSLNAVGLSNASLSGTWRCMGFSRRTNDLSNISQSATLWLRIS
jgi:hypothetical protein